MTGENDDTGVTQAPHEGQDRDVWDQRSSRHRCTTVGRSKVCEVDERK